MGDDVRPEVLEVCVFLDPYAESPKGDTRNRPRAKEVVEDTVDAQHGAKPRVISAPRRAELARYVKTGLKTYPSDLAASLNSNHLLKTTSEIVPSATYQTESMGE